MQLTAAAEYNNNNHDHDDENYNDGHHHSRLIVASHRVDTTGKRKNTQNIGGKKKIMIDINKTTGSNYQKFSTLKTKCDPVAFVKSVATKFPSSSGNKASGVAELTRRATKGKPEPPVAATVVSEADPKPGEAIKKSNPVREANQNFFLVSEFKDQNFLKEECERALAQVSPQKKRNQELSVAAAAQGGGGEDNRNNNFDVIDDVPDSSSKRPSFGQNARSSIVSLPAVSLNVMRRVNGHGGLMGSAFTANSSSNGARVNIHQIEYEGPQHQQPQQQHPVRHLTKAATTTTTTIKTAVPAASSFCLPSAKVNGGQRAVKPLGGHRTIPSTAVAAVTAVGTTASTSTTAENSLNYSNNNSNSGINRKNNNTSGNNQSHSSNCNNNNNNNNNNMQIDQDDDDIKYIDSDETPADRRSMQKQQQMKTGGTIGGGSSSAGGSGGGVVGMNKNTDRRMRPKSTIVCSTNSIVFEKVNNYKTTNGMSGAAPVNSGGGVRASTPAARSASTTTSSTAIASTALRRRAIDSSGIQASIEKFNNFSELKRLPSAGVALRSHSGSGSTSNLQHHRHSSDFDGGNVRFTTNGSGDSLPRPSNRYGATAAVAPRLAAGTSKATASIHPAGPSALATTTLRAGLAGNTNSLPSKSSASSRNHETVLASGSLERGSESLVHLKNIDTTTAKTLSAPATRKQQQQQQQHELIPAAVAGTTALASTSTSTSTVADMKPANCGGTTIGDVESSIRSTAIRSTLPPASPTTTRYWDRDGIRTSSLSSTSTSTHNNVDESTKSTAAPSDEKTEGLCGLRNIGNTCFMNSVIQCLSHTSELTKFLRNHTGTRSATTKDSQILYEFAKLIREMWTSNARCVTPMELKRAFSSKHRMYSDYNQQDAQEFLRFFLDSLHSALNSGAKGEPLKIDDNLSDNKKADLTWEWYARQENSLIRDLFVGQLKSTLRCTTCGNTSVTFDPFWDLSVPLPSSSRCKLDACLELFIREEILDGDEMPTCSKCKTRRKCTKSFSIQRFPKYLVIHLKRFSETRWSKMSNIVEFPTGERELNMGPYGSNPSANMYYSLYGISNHMGSTAGGHYVALCKHPLSKKWHEFNDNIVSESLSENHLVTSSAYILFYERT